MKRDLILRPYQLAPAKFALETDKGVLAAAPNSGKSEIAIYVMSEYLKENPDHRVLFMPHATNVILDNIMDRMDELNLNFSYSRDVESDAQVHVSLPHSEEDLKKNRYNFVIVDEAHEHYMKKRMQGIIKACKPTKQLLLTGTPENFIKKGGYDIHCLAANQISAEWFSKLHIELVASNYNWKDSYNADQQVKDDFKYDKKDTEKTLENIVMSLLGRVKGNFTADEFNQVKILPKIKSWFKISRSIGKTLITCRSISQANQTYKILQKQGVNVGVSHSKSDLDSQEIAKFKKGEYDIMVVVNRARLGYSDDGLMNVIDMSGTHNPSLIYQTFSRASRGTPDQQKYYLKVTPQGGGQMDLTHMSVCAALMLTDEKYLSTYNGSNFSGIIIPVLKNSRSRSGGSGSGKTRPKKDKVIFPSYSNDVFDLFKNIIGDMDKSASIYKGTTIGEVRHILKFSKQFPRGYWDKKEKCHKEALRYNGRGKFRSESKSAYTIALKNEWMDDICSHMDGIKQKGYWQNRDNCHKESLKYDTRKEFRYESCGAYGVALEKKWINYICSHMIFKRTPRGHWDDKENCRKKTLECNTRSEFSRRSSGAYKSASKNNWLDEFFPKTTKV